MFTRTAFLAALCLGLMNSSAVAQDGETSFSLELNTARETDKGCELVVLIRNNTPKTLDRGIWNLAFFDTDTKFSKLLSMELKKIRAGSAHAKVFTLRDTQCSGISWILVNDAPVCQLDGGTETDPFCLDALKADSTDEKIRFGTS